VFISQFLKTAEQENESGSGGQTRNRFFVCPAFQAARQAILETFRLKSKPGERSLV
jgi:hypothetical protein